MFNVGYYDQNKGMIVRIKKMNLRIGARDKERSNERIRCGRKRFGNGKFMMR